MNSFILSAVSDIAVDFIAGPHWVFYSRTAYSIWSLSQLYCSLCNSLPNSIHLQMF